MAMCSLSKTRGTRRATIFASTRQIRAVAATSPQLILDKLRTYCGGTVGQMEALAGLECDHASRFAFWVECDQIARQRQGAAWAPGSDVLEVARELCHSMTVKRVRRGDLCLV